MSPLAPLEIFDVEQGSTEWFKVRAGCVTASKFKDVLAKGQGKTRRSYLMTLAGELICGEPAPDEYKNSAMERGNLMEAEAIALYEFRESVTTEKCGFMRRGRIGCSPDRLVAATGMVQVKTTLPKLLGEILLADEVPSEHWPQVQGELMVSGREHSDLVIYWPRMPLFVKRIYRDEKFIAGLRVDLDTFVGDLDKVVEQLRAYA